MAFRSLSLLGGRVDAVGQPEVVRIVRQTLERGRFLQIITVNLLMLREAQNDGELRGVFSSAVLALPDSVGIRALAALKGLPLPERIPGIDLLKTLCAEAGEKGWSIFLIGAKPGVADKAAKNLRAEFPRLNVAGAAHGYLTGEQEAALLKEIGQKKPGLVFVALQIPQQEKWIAKNLSAFKGLCAMGVGGSFDVLSGNLKRAPLWLRKSGLEWLFRLAQEPWRWQRMASLPFILVRGALAPSSISER